MTSRLSLLSPPLPRHHPCSLRQLSALSSLSPRSWSCLGYHRLSIRPRTTLARSPTGFNCSPSTAAASSFVHPRIPASKRRHFSQGRATMVATKIDGTATAKSIREGLNAEIREAQASNPRFKPSLLIFQGKYRAPAKKILNFKFKFNRIY